MRLRTLPGVGIASEAAGGGVELLEPGVPGDEVAAQCGCDAFDLAPAELDRLCGCLRERVLERVRDLALSGIVNWVEGEAVPEPRGEPGCAADVERVGPATDEHGRAHVGQPTRTGTGR